MMNRDSRRLRASGETLVFRPRPSLGWLSLSVLGAVILAATSWVLLVEPEKVPWPIIAFSLIICLGLGLPFLALATMFPTMRYELDNQALTLRYGPVLRYRIPLSEIRSIRRRNLAISLWSAIRLPGVALFTVPYADVGEVKMCATAAADRILLVETARARYGLTPVDEEGLVAALRARMES